MPTYETIVYTTINVKADNEEMALAAARQFVEDMDEDILKESLSFKIPGNYGGIDLIQCLDEC